LAANPQSNVRVCDEEKTVGAALSAGRAFPQGRNLSSNHFHAK